MDRREHHSAAGPIEQLPEVVAALRLHRHLAEDLSTALKLPVELIIEVVAIGEHDERRVLHRRVADDAGGVEKHRKALPAPLRVPHHPGAPIAQLSTARRPVGRSQATGSDRLANSRADGVKLVVAGDDLMKGPGVGVFVEDHKVLEELEKPAPLKHAPQERLQFRHRFQRIARSVDRRPDLEPFLVCGERPEPGLKAVADDEQGVVVGDRGDLGLIRLELGIGRPDRGIVIGGVFQLDQGQR